MTCISIDSHISDKINSLEVRCSGLLRRDDVSGQPIWVSSSGGGWRVVNATT